jgi:hypothetical protein
MKKVKNDFPAPRSIKPNLSERLDWAIRRAMSADPAQRPATCREFVEDLTGASAAVNAPPSSAYLGGNPTSPETATPPPTDPLDVPLWYMVYRGPDGQPLTVKGTAASIRENLKRDALGDPHTIMVARAKTGPFQPLKMHAEFRDLVVSPATVTPQKIVSKGRAPSTPAPGERTGRLPIPEGVDSPGANPPRFTAPRASRQGTQFIAQHAAASRRLIPTWLPWAIIAVLSTAVVIMAMIVFKRGA